MIPLLSSLHVLAQVDNIKDGDLLVIQRKQDDRKILVKCHEVINRKTGKEEILLSQGNNDYFIWNMYLEGKSWVSRVWHIGPVELTSITNNLNEFPRS